MEWDCTDGVPPRVLSWPWMGDLNYRCGIVGCCYSLASPRMVSWVTVSVPPGSPTPLSLWKDPLSLTCPAAPLLPGPPGCWCRLDWGRQAGVRPPPTHLLLPCPLSTCLTLPPLLHTVVGWTRGGRQMPLPCPTLTRPRLVSPTVTAVGWTRGSRQVHAPFPSAPSLPLIQPLLAPLPPSYPGPLLQAGLGSAGRCTAKAQPHHK